MQCCRIRQPDIWCGRLGPLLRRGPILLCRLLIPTTALEAMTKDRAATLTASVGAGLLFGTAGFHLSAYGSVVNRAPADLQPLMAALWVAGGTSLIIAGLLAVAVTPLFVV